MGFFSESMQLRSHYQVSNSTYLEYYHRTRDLYTGGLTWKDGNSQKLPFIYFVNKTFHRSGATCGVKACFIGKSGNDKSINGEFFII